MQERAEWLGVGLYTAAEASRLLALPVAKVRRWLGGYREAGRKCRPLWRPQLPKLNDQLGLGFLDLMQLRLVARVIADTDISLQKLWSWRRIRGGCRIPHIVNPHYVNHYI